MSKKLTIKNAYLEITSRCNLRCIHCYNASGDIAYCDMDLAVLAMLTDFLRDKGLELLSISGGEPLLHPQCRTILEMCKAKQFRVLLATNGLQLLQNLEALKFVDIIQVSLDGATAAVHDSIRGKGSFERVIDQLKELKQYQLNPKVVLRVTVNKHNYDHIEDIVLLAIKLGLVGVTFSLIRPSGRGRTYYAALKLSSDEIICTRLPVITTTTCQIFQF